MGECPVCLGEGEIPAVPEPMECPNCAGTGEDEDVPESPDVGEKDAAGVGDASLSSPLADRIRDAVAPHGVSVDMGKLSDALEGTVGWLYNFKTSYEEGPGGFGQRRLDLELRLNPRMPDGHAGSFNPHVYMIAEAIGGGAVTDTSTRLSAGEAPEMEVNISVLCPVEQFPSGGSTTASPSESYTGPTRSAVDFSSTGAVVSVRSAAGELLTVGQNALAEAVSSGVATINVQGEVDGLPSEYIIDSLPG